MPLVDDCIFCKIAAGAEPSHVVFEDESHLGFLDIFPNTEGFSVVITKEHHPSDVARADAEVVSELMTAARLVAAKIARTYDDVDRCAVVIEGMMIDHLDAKVIPMHQTAGRRPDPGDEMTARGDQFFEAYPGYITTKIMNRQADEDHLAAVAAKINATE